MGETPKHYDKAVQPWDAMRAWMTPEEFKGFLRGNAIKYLARCRDKGGLEDLKKAAHYLEKLIEEEGTVADPPPVEIVWQTHAWDYVFDDDERQCVRCGIWQTDPAASKACCPSSRKPAEGVTDAATADPS